MVNQRSVQSLESHHSQSGSDKKVRVMFCPSCKSFDVKYTFGLGNLFGVIPKQVCGDCSFSAPSFPILETTQKGLSKGFSSSKSSGRSQ